MIQNITSLFDLFEAFPTEQHAIDHLRAIRWGENDENACCPHCGSTRIMHFKDRKNHKCSDCRKRFSIKVGTIFHDSKIQLRKWFAAIWMITSHKKGIASTQLAKDIKVTQKTAWFMLHRLRHAASTKSFNTPLAGDVEADETYVGGKAKNMHLKDRGTGKKFKKEAVVGIIKRDGELRAKHVPVVTKATIHGAVRQNVSPDARFITDASPLYKGLASEFDHHVVNHNKGQYVVEGNVHTNSIESVWALFKRQLIGTHHWVSKKHLQRYVDEMTWRFNHRSNGEGQRVNNLLGQLSGRLTYKALIA